MSDKEFIPSPHDAAMIARYKYSDAHNADRVFVVNPEALGNSQASCACSPAEPKIVYVDKPIVVEQSKIVEIEKPVLVEHKDVRIEYVEKQVVVEQKSVEIVKVETQVLVPHVEFIDRPVIVEKAQEMPKWVKYVAISHTVLMFGLLIALLLK